MRGTATIQLSFAYSQEKFMLQMKCELVSLSKLFIAVNYDCEKWYGILKTLNWHDWIIIGVISAHDILIHFVRVAADACWR